MSRGRFIDELWHSRQLRKVVKSFMVAEVNPILRQIHFMQKPGRIFLELFVKVMNTVGDFLFGEFLIALQFFLVFFESFLAAQAQRSP